MDEEARHADVEDGQDTDYMHASLLHVQPDLFARFAQRGLFRRCVSGVDRAAGQADLPGVAVAAFCTLGQHDVCLVVCIRVDQDQDRRRAAPAVGARRARHLVAGFVNDKGNELARNRRQVRRERVQASPDVFDFQRLPGSCTKPLNCASAGTFFASTETW